MMSPIDILIDRLDIINKGIYTNLEIQKEISEKLEQEKVTLQTYYTAKRNYENAIEILNSTDSE